MKRVLLPIFYVLAVQFSYAQFFTGLRASNFGGVTNVNYNPAIADNRFICDINLFNFALQAGNNYVGFSPNAILKPSDNGDFQDLYMTERVNGKPKNAYVGFQSQMPLSFMFSFGKKNKNAIALTWHMNGVVNLDDVDEPLARIAYHGLTGIAENYFLQSFSDDNVSAQAFAWMDYGLTYSRVAWDKGPHMLKAGITVKAIQGLAAGYLFAKDLKYKWENSDTLDIFQTQANYGHDGRDYDNLFDDFSLNNIMQGSKYSVGFDIGVVYEWRPKKEKYDYQMDGKDLWRKDKDRYLLAAGLSITDMGSVKMDKGQYSRSFVANINDWNVGGITFNGLQGFDDTIQSRFLVNDPKGTFHMGLPTRINAYLDYNIYKGLGLNLATSISPLFRFDQNRVHHPTTITLTPRYDHAWFGAYIPFTYDISNNSPNLGLTLRMGPLIIGTQDILFLAKKHFYGADVHVALKLPIPYGKKKDRDKDGVSNKKDKCKKEPGPWATMGCPDRDNDSIVDSQDKCPDIPGPRKYDGCPDRDGDGVIDPQDTCVDVPGLAQFHGCPDRDGDGVEDRFDECPDVKGLPEFKGCPDTDGDGVEDRVDDCPEVKGSKEHKGCPDSDGDGLYDNEDKCIRDPGPVENQGCPWPDTDNDGVLDKDDACITVPGPADNKGCPKLEKKELETVKMAFENLEFETGKDVIRKGSYPSLNALADLLVKKENYGLLIEGHTDNVGNDDYNLDLSIRRAAAVKNYLIKRGVKAEKLASNGYGESKPIADNGTPAGRQKNRRVEMTVTFR